MKKICKVNNCNSIHEALGYCIKHLRQIKRFGVIQKYTRYDKNEISDRGGYLEISLYNTKLEIIAYSKIDKKSLDLIKNYRWCLVDGYVSAKSNTILLHRLLTNCPANKYVDHINGDPLDNQLKNLRTVSPSQNVMNRRKGLNTSSKYKGVTIIKRINKNNIYIRWMSQIKFKNKLKSKIFKDEISAAKNYDIWAKELFGDYAKLNFQV